MIIFNRIFFIKSAAVAVLLTSGFTFAGDISVDAVQSRYAEVVESRANEPLQPIVPGLMSDWANNDSVKPQTELDRWVGAWVTFLATGQSVSEPISFQSALQAHKAELWNKVVKLRKADSIFAVTSDSQRPQPVWIPAEDLRYILDPVKGYLREGFETLLTNLSGVWLEPAENGVMVSAWFKNEFRLTLKQNPEKNEAYALDIPLSVRLWVESSATEIKVQAFNREIQSVKIYVNLPFVPDGVTFREAVVDLYGQQLKVAAGILWDNIEVIGKMPLEPGKLKPVLDIREMIERNLGRLVSLF